MTEEIQIPPIFKNEPISKRLVCGITFCLFPNRIFYVSIPKYYKITMEVVDEGYRFLNENVGGFVRLSFVEKNKDDEENNFDSDVTWAWTSRPITTSY